MSDTPAKLSFNNDAQARVTRIGRGGIAVARVEDVLCHPESVAIAGFAASYAEDRDNLYPGMRAPMPESFSMAFGAWLTPILQRSGMLDSHRAIRRAESFFSVVTTPGEDLLPIQCIPHYDSTNPDLLAAVIYLCDPRFSGTSFYRHRRTGYEEITAENQDNYRLALNSDLRSYGLPQRQYINGDSLLFEVIYSNELRFNSMIVYPGRILHAGNLEPRLKAPRDKNDWRLTITSLFSITGRSGETNPPES